MNAFEEQFEAKAAPYRVLAIDDSPESLDLVRGALSPGFHVQAATDGQRGLQLARRHHPDLIVLDVLMPDMDGHEVCRRLRADPATCDIPVIFVTGLTSEGDELRGFELGAVDFVSKPIEPVILQARVRTQVELAAARRELARANAHMAQERELIAEVVLSMRNDEQFCPARLTWVSQSQDAAGGDLVLSAMRPNGDEHVLIGDFTGHGLPAAIGTPLVSHLFYSLTAANLPLGDVLREINNVLVRRLPLQFFMASAAVCIPASSVHAEIWSFGNPDLLHRDAAGHWTSHVARELPMGIVRHDAPYPSETVSLDRDECLFLMTDGPIEASCSSGGTFGVERIRSVLAANALSDEAVLESVVACTAAPRALDDMTILRIDGGPRR